MKRIAQTGDTGDEERPNTPAPSTSKRIIVKSKLIKKSSNGNISKEMKDYLKRNKRVKEEVKNKKNEENIKKEEINEVIICKKNEDSEGLPRQCLRGKIWRKC